jgi:ribosome-associated protein
MTPRQLARLVSEAAESKKARDVVEIDLRERSDVADFFVVCEGDTDRQTRAISDAIREAAHKKGISPFSTAGEREGSWILMDFITVVVHIFIPGERAFYDLESLWSETKKRTGRTAPPKAATVRTAAARRARA